MKKILLLLKMPPPYAGPEVMAEQLFLSDTFNKNRETVFINANLKKKNKDKGKISAAGLYRLLTIIVKFIYNLSKSHTVFMYICSGKWGFLRDTIYIHLCKIFRRKCIVQYHGANFHNFYNKQNRIYQSWIRFSLSKVDKILVLGHSLKFMFKDIYNGEIRVLYNGLRTKDIVIKEKKSDVFTILFMGHLWYPKGFWDLVRVYKELHQTYGNKVRFLFAGEKIGYTNTAFEFLNNEFAEFYRQNGKLITDEIHQFINTANMYNAEYLGFISGNKKTETFNKSNILVLPSYTEGFSMACLEAMSFGLPVVTTPVGAMPEIIKDKKNGILTPVGNQKELKKNIETLMNDFNLYSSIVKYNPLYIKENFDIEKIAADLLNQLKN